ncbi:SRPBCC domain-containing protein [Solitalea sp. MAHUQ-68]|uniref:SRPBCC domain-containing protein n=1 Tax=Solitalea agri TaxID=2953739 RepID=A0A9X2F003_9SPHI|nr:SRPBCC domain-containing protein [Solitalea agri]MCO4292184.1 SRPBCC domain-containing protein [Solitalea agri]
MTTTDFTTGFTVNQTPEEVFNAINNVRGWWSEDIEGNTDKLNDEFLYHYKDIHFCKIKLIELIPNQKVVWLVTENDFNFIEDKTEWVGNKMIFEITEKDNKTELQFTQEGLVPANECYSICHDAWTGFIKNSLHNLITTGKGSPNPKDEEGGVNRELREKYFENNN